MKLEKKERVGSKTVRTDGQTLTPLERVLASAEVSAATKAQLRAEKAALNPFALRREVDRQLQATKTVWRIYECRNRLWSKGNEESAEQTSALLLPSTA
jgi:hypothetical protein